MWIVIFVLIVIIGVLLYVVRNLFNKVNKCEDMLEKAYEANAITLNKIASWMKISLDKLHNIDRLQIFEGDDDVGWFFKTLKFQITELNNQIAIIIGEETVDEEDKEEEK